MATGPAKGALGGLPCAAGKAVLAAEYTDTGAKTSEFCPQARRLGFDAILKQRNHGVQRRSC